jgi:hypothetical protein
MTVQELQRIVLHIGNQMFVRYYLWLNYPNDPQLMGIQPLGIHMLGKELEELGFTWRDDLKLFAIERTEEKSRAEVVVISATDLQELCRCDCASCAAGDHAGCYYWPQPICCPIEPIRGPVALAPTPPCSSMPAPWPADPPPPPPPPEVPAAVLEYTDPSIPGAEVWKRHLDACRWCRQRPGDPCKIGRKRLAEAAATIGRAPTPPLKPEEPQD